MNIDIKTNNSDRNSASYLNLTAELGLLPAHTNPTRLANCLDHFLTNTPESAAAFVVDSTVSDHASVLLSLSCSRSVQASRNNVYKRIDYEAALAHLQTVDFSFVNDDADANDAATRFVEHVSGALTQHSTLISRPCRKRLLKPWLTSGLLRCIRHRDKLHKYAAKNPQNESAKLTYKRYRNFCNALLVKLKRSYEKSLLENANCNKNKWNAVKSIINTSREKTVGDHLLVPHKSSSSAVNDVNTYFSNISKLLADKITAPQNEYNFEINPVPNSIVLLPPDEDEINALIMNLRNDCATGWDSIPAKFLKTARHIIVPHLTKLIEICLTQGVFPKVFKKSLITPVHKGGKKDDVGNYRPISVLTTMSKILEKVLNNRLTNFLQHNKILADAQFGFRLGKSTEDAVSQLVEHVTLKLDQKEKCVGIFLDLAKAFDTVMIPFLVSKLEKIGIRGTALGIFKDFLTDRTQRVKIREYISSDAWVTYGVPQGSILGPSLFLIYINDLCQLQLTNGNIFTYADDTALVFHGETWDEVKKSAELGLHTVGHWLRSNRLTLNLNKSTFLQFSFSKIKPISLDIKLHVCNLASTVKCSCTTISQSTHVRYLGVIVDDKLSWQQHIDVTTTRVRKLIWAFKKLRHVAKFELLRTVYYALVQSVLGYCIVVWGGGCKTFMIHLERAQRSLLKVMTFRPFRFPTKVLYEKCEVLTVRQNFILQVVTKQHIVTPYDARLYMKRTVPNVCLPVRCRTVSARRQQVYLATFLYDKLNRILTINPLTTRETKRRVRKWLLSQDYFEIENVLYSN